MRQKYGNKKAICNGIQFDSRKERDRYRKLALLEQAGEISDLRLQVPFELIPAIYEQQEVQLKTKTKIVSKCIQKPVRYIADFVYHDKDGNEIVEDAKGMRTKEYVLKKKMMRALLGITIQEV